MHGSWCTSLIGIFEPSLDLLREHGEQRCASGGVALRRLETALRRGDSVRILLPNKAPVKGQDRISRPGPESGCRKQIADEKAGLRRDAVRILTQFHFREFCKKEFFNSHLGKETQPLEKGTGGGWTGPTNF